MSFFCSKKCILGGMSIIEKKGQRTELQLKILRIKSYFSQHQTGKSAFLFVSDLSKISEIHREKSKMCVARVVLLSFSLGNEAKNVLKSRFR